MAALSVPTEAMVKEVSAHFTQPGQFAHQRLASLDSFNKLPIEKSPLYSKYVDMVLGLNLENIEPGLPGNYSHLPAEIKHLVKGGDQETLALQVDSQNIETQVRTELEKEGVVYTDLKSAFSKSLGLVADHFSRAVQPDGDKFAALNNAFYTTGTFLHVPKGLTIKVPLRNLVLIKSGGKAVFSHNIIIAEENSKVTFLQEAYSNLDAQNTPALYSEVSEVYLNEGAEVNFASIQNFEGQVHSLLNRRALGQRDSRINWTIGHIGGGITRSRTDSAMEGPGSTAEDVEIVFGGENQRFDIVTDLSHNSEHTTGHVLARGVLKDSSRSVFKGMIRIAKGAKNSNSYLAEHAMILSKKARADAIPGLEIETNEVKATHSGSVSQVDEEQIFYMMARGLTRNEAEKLIIVGFLHPAVKRIPLKAVRAGIQFLIEEKWVGRGSKIPPRADLLPEFEEEPERSDVPSDIFERHYKYR